MAKYRNKITGKVFLMRLNIGYKMRTISLHHDETDYLVGKIDFIIDVQNARVDIEDLTVTGHSNLVGAGINPYPGTGRLLLYLACRYAKQQGARRVRLESLSSATGFYIKAGFHPVKVQRPGFSPDQLGEGGVPTFAALKDFWQDIDLPGYLPETMTTYIDTVLNLTNRSVFTQWDECLF